MKYAIIAVIIIIIVYLFISLGKSRTVGPMEKKKVDVDNNEDFIDDPAVEGEVIDNNDGQD